MKRHDGSTHIGSVETDQKPCIWLYKCFRLVKKKITIMVTGDTVKSYSLLRKLDKRTHDGIVFHGSYQNMISWFENSFEQDIQAHGDILCEDHIFSFTGCKMEQASKLFSCFKNLFFYRVGSTIASASYIDSTAGEILINGVCNRWEFGEGSACLIQIYFLHKITSYKFD